MIAFIVEGHMEKAIVNELCPGSPVRLLGVNGDRVEVKTLVKFAHAQLLELRNRYYPVYIIFDRERRASTCAQIECALESGLIGLGNQKGQFVCLTADRTVESWIYPFLDASGAVLSSPLSGQVGEGSDGKPLVKAVFRKLGKPYVETVDGVNLFLALNRAATVSVSPSFARVSGAFPNCTSMV